MKRPYGDAELRAYSDGHLSYEVWMFFEIVDSLRQPLAARSVPVSSTSSSPTMPTPPLGVPNSIAPPLGTKPRRLTVADNLRIEGFMAHLRNLIDFLFTLSPADTDVAAVDFCPPETWKPVIPQALLDAKRRVNKELAHLAAERISGSPLRKQWDFAGLSDEVKLLLSDFVAKADPPRLSPRVKRLIS